MTQVLTLLALVALVGQTGSAIPARDSDAFDEAFDAQFYYPPPSPEAQRVDNEADGNRIDADYFAAFPDHDRSYSASARAKARKLIQTLRRDAADLSHEEFVLRVAEIAALADNAHTNVNENAFRKNTPRIPVRAYPFADDHHILWTNPGLKHLLGARIDRIEDRPIESVKSALRKYSGGTIKRRDINLLSLLESPAMLHAAGLSERRDRLRVSGVTLDGDPFDIVLAAEERGQAAWVSSASWMLFPRPAGNRMISLFSRDEPLPLYLRSPTQLLSVEAAPNGGLYFAMGTNLDSDEASLADYLGKLLEHVRAEQPRYFILDLRMNGGGDLTKSYQFAHMLPEMMSGRPIYALTSPWTFSAAITTLTALKTAGGQQVIQVGDDVGDRLDFWAEGGTFMLPNNLIPVHYTSGRHVYDDECSSGRDCYWLLRDMELRVPDLSPDIRAPHTFDAYRRKVDPAMEAVLTHYSNHN